MARPRTISTQRPNPGPARVRVVTIAIASLFATFSASAATQGTYNSGTGVWTVGTVTTTAPDTLAITATVDAATAGSTIVNTASVTASDQADGNAANHPDTPSVTAQGAALAVVKTVDDPAPNEGGTVVFTVALSNEEVVTDALILLNAGGAKPAPARDRVEDRRVDNGHRAHDPEPYLNARDWITIQNTEANPSVTSAKVIPFTRGSTIANKNASSRPVIRTTPKAAIQCISWVFSMIPNVYAPTAKNMAWPNESNPVTPRIRS